MIQPVSEQRLSVMSSPQDDICAADAENCMKMYRVNHTGKCIRRFAGIYAYCRYFISRKW